MEKNEKCSPSCPYFPQEVSEKYVVSSWRDEYGVLHRKVKRYCKYDGHLIKNWDTPCPKNKK